MTAFEFARSLQDRDFRHRAMRAGYIAGTVTDVAALEQAMNDGGWAEPLPYPQPTEGTPR